MYLPLPDPGLYQTQGFVALWQPTPLFVNFLLVIISTLYGSTYFNKTKVKAGAEVKYLSRLYLISFAVSTVAHIGAILACLFSESPEASIYRTLGHVTLSDKFTMYECLLYVFQADFWIIFASALVSAYISLWDVQRSGFASWGMGQALVYMLIGSIVVGPGATLAAAWYVREQALAQGKTKSK
jgi:hypothetical protein